MPSESDKFQSERAVLDAALDYAGSLLNDSQFEALKIIQDMAVDYSIPIDVREGLREDAKRRTAPSFEKLATLKAACILYARVNVV